MAMTKEARALRAAYMREWRKRNPQKQSEYTARKWENKAAKKAQEERAAQSEESN
jgi:hypothetical protein